jgi:hypothetical protein
LRLQRELDRARAADLVQRVEAPLAPPEPRLLARVNRRKQLVSLSLFKKDITWRQLANFDVMSAEQ